MGQIIVRAYHEGVKGIFWVEVGVLQGSMADLLLFCIDQELFLSMGRAFFCFLFGDKINLALDPCLFLNGYLQEKSILFADIADHGTVRDRDHGCVAIHMVELERKEPGPVGYIHDIVLFL